MTEDGRSTLRQLLLNSYDDLMRSLASRLGNTELARDAMQDTFLRLEGGGELGPIQSPRAYLFRMALNIAHNRRTAERRLLSVSEIETFLEIPDETPDPARQLEARSEIEALKRALMEMPERRRGIFLAAWVEEISQQEIAKRFDLSLRSVQLELRDALAHCATRLDRDTMKNFASRRRRLSSV